MSCHHPERIVEDGGPRNPWRGYTFCGDCGETIGAKWRRMIDDICERNWGYRPNRTKPAATIEQGRG
jgi:hypothetical protein